MTDLSPEIELTTTQAEAIARGLIAVAKADGQVHEREGALIAEFYGSLTDHPTDLVALQKSEPADGEYLAATLPPGEVRKLFLKTAILLAYADGNYSGTESRLISSYATDLGVSDVELQALEQQVKEFMLSQLTGIRNTEAVAEVAHELKA
jgi:tellurite resistance protein